MRRFVCGVALACALGIASAGRADEGAAVLRPPAPNVPRGFVGGALGGQVTRSDFTAGATFSLYGDQGRFDAASKLPAGLSVEGSGGVRLWRTFGVDLAVSRYSGTETTVITGSIPHPYFPLLRALNATWPGLQRTETGAHPGVYWMKRLSRRAVLTIAGGPSLVWFRQDLVTGLNLIETYPYDDAQLGSPAVKRQSGLAIGGHVSGDMYVRVAPNVAVGGGGRWTRATRTVDVTTGQSTSIATGGLQIAGGLRWLF